jgi:hypothetical protein
MYRAEADPAAEAESLQKREEALSEIDRNASASWVSCGQVGALAMAAAQNDRCFVG